MPEDSSASNGGSSWVRTQSVLDDSPLSSRDEVSVGRQEATESETLSVDRLQTAVAELFTALSHTLQEERERAAECVERASAILRIKPPLAMTSTEPEFASSEKSKRIGGGLAPWQIGRLTTYIHTNLGATIRTKDLAALVRLSDCHFSRAFKHSFGDTPHSYVMRRRVERAQGLLLTTTVSLCEIAWDCGFADQAHFNKLFRRFVGETPAAWRRARAIAPA